MWKVDVKNANGEVSLQRAFALLLLIGVCHVVALIIYRLYFHPLAKFPGPFWARISAFPAYYHTLKRDRHLWFWSLQQKYGPNLRITPNSVLINTPTGVKNIYSKQANIQKSEYYKAYPRTVDSMTTWNSIDKKVHTRKRRVLAHAFSEKAIRSSEEFVHSNVDRWCKLIDSEIGENEFSKPLNMANWLNYLVFDILGDLCFGESFNMKEPESELRYAPELILSYFSILHPIAFSPFTPFFNWLKPRGLNQLMLKTAPAAIQNWQAFVETCFAKRAKAEEDIQGKGTPESEIRKDFFHYLFKAVDPDTGKPGYTPEELYGETELLIIAGSDTTSISLAAALFYLVRYPEVQRKLAEEVRSTFSSLAEIKGGTEMSSCKYLHAVIEESLRMSPPGPGDLSREVSPGGAVVDGHFLPQGIKVSSAIYCLHYNEQIYPEPFKFRPERWIVDENDTTGASAEEVALAQSGFCAFSAGPRNCLGKNLAYLEMSIVVAKLIFQFDLQQDPTNNIGGGGPDAGFGREHVDQYQLYDVFVSIRDGPMVQFKRKQEN